MDTSAELERVRAEKSSAEEALAAFKKKTKIYIDQKTKQHEEVSSLPPLIYAVIELMTVFAGYIRDYKEIRK